MIYNEEADKLDHITFEEALYATCVGDAAGGFIDITKAFGTIDDTKSKAHITAAGITLAAALDLTTVTGILDAVKAGVWVPVCITIARPFIEHLMMSAVITVSGRDTGATLFGPADMQISANTSVKTIEGHVSRHWLPSDEHVAYSLSDACIHSTLATRSR